VIGSAVEYYHHYIFGVQYWREHKRKSTRCSCTSCCKFSFCLLCNSSQTYYEL